MEKERMANPFGVEAITVELPANIVFAAKQAADWKYRDVPEKFRGTLEAQVQSVIFDAVQAAAAAAENAAYAKMLRLITKIAQQSNKTISDVAADFKFQLREQV